VLLIKSLNYFNSKLNNIRPDVSERGLPRGKNLNNIVRSIKLHISLLKYD